MVKPFNIDLLKSQVFNLIRQRRTLMNKLGGQETQEEKLKQLKLNSADDRLIEMIVEEINKNLTNSDLNVDMLAEKVGLSRVHLYRKMKELTNQTPHGFIRNTRIRQAARLLREPGHNVTEVMYACGFSNLASFSTMFKSMYGMSPRDYIREHQK
jgi:AraC-like DNA-binding protein